MQGSQEGSQLVVAWHQIVQRSLIGGRQLCSEKSVLVSLSRKRTKKGPMGPSIFKKPIKKVSTNVYNPLAHRRRIMKMVRLYHDH